MKIAIYHNLEKGGAQNYLFEILKVLSIKNKIDIYCHKNTLHTIKNTNTFVYPLNQTNNIFTHMYQIFFELKQINFEISKKINKNKYDLVIVFQCLLTQSPYLLKFLHKNTPSIYILNEPKREFYENTSFDHYSIKKILARLFRLPIKYIDIFNGKSAKIIISNSVYSSQLINKIYGKNSYVIYPGLEQIKPTTIKQKNKYNFISIGLLSKIKGHVFSIKQLHSLTKTISIIGRDSIESKYIFNQASINNIHLRKLIIKNDQEKFLILKKYSFYLANNENEPFGITTLEATANNIFVLGKNEGGTSEIIRSGINGFLYPNKLSIAQQTTKNYLNIKNINYYNNCRINWKSTTKKIISIYNHIYNA